MNVNIVIASFAYKPAPEQAMVLLQANACANLCADAHCSQAPMLSMDSDVGNLLLGWEGLVGSWSCQNPELPMAKKSRFIIRP